MNFSLELKNVVEVGQIGKLCSLCPFFPWMIDLFRNNIKIILNGSILYKVQKVVLCLARLKHHEITEVT